MTKRLLLRMAILAASLAATLAASHADAAPKKKKPAKPAASQPASEPAPATQSTDQPIIEIEPETQPATTTPTTASPSTPEPVDTAGAAPPPVAAGTKQESWQDVVVVVRKPFLKQGRFELQPLFQVTLNDNMIRHYAPSAQLIYWLTDVLGVGVEGQWYTHFDTFLEAHDLVKEDYRRLPTLNEYKFGAALDFHYVPIYAKFALLNKYMVHWEGMFSIGVGVTESSILPRDPAFQSWDNYDITPNVGFQLRFFLTSWLMLNLSVKDYIFVDKFESVARTAIMSVDQAKDAASSQLINNIMFGVGISLWVPPTFSYTTFR